jgi:hypothetical protein
MVWKDPKPENGGSYGHRLKEKTAYLRKRRKLSIALPGKALKPLDRAVLGKLTDFLS